MPRPDRHNEIEMNFMMSGSLTYLLGGSRTTIRAANLAIFWAAIPHQIVAFDGDAPYFVVTLPLSEFLRAGVDSSLVHRVLEGELLTDSAEDGSDRIAFERWEEDLMSADPVLERAARLEVQARLLRFARGMSPAAVAGTTSRLSRADQLACYIAKNYQEPLTSQIIAEAHGVHPNYAMNLFRKAFGTTMTAFIVQHRISHAQRLLVTTEDTILNVAMNSGFQSLSRFNEAFKAECGCSPRDYRKSHHPTVQTLSIDD
ncbi:helix-turn-helix domain-containing protein [Roseiconus nitratireducens]|nr:helix-turn-helix domain-containing protein [Roseiconus nitratireducens]